MASWNCVKEVAGGGFEVRLGAEGDHKCGFSFATEITLADLVLVCGPTMTVLDVNNQKCSGKKLSFSFTDEYFGAHPSFLGPFSADDVCCRCFAGDIQVFENTPSMTFINLRNTTCTGKKCFLRPSFVDYLKATDIARANDLQATFRCWPIASR